MKALNIYLIFDGNCHDAMKFYKDCFGGELEIHKYSENPSQTTEKDKNKLMHARLTKGDMTLMASDNSSKSPMPLKMGNNFSISLEPESIEETERFFNALSKGGKVHMKLEETFFAKRFGMFTDKFGINWMVNLIKPH
jgi:PhnB protein